MIKLWQRYAARIDALTTRERVLVLVTAVAVPVFLLHTLFIDPAVTRRKALSVRMAQQQIELQALQVKLQTLEKQRADPDAAQAARRDESKRQIAEIDATLKNLQSGLVPAQQMNALLQDVLKRNPRLHLVAVTTLPAAPLVEKREPADKSAAAASSPKPPDRSGAQTGGVFKHGVQITLQGSYADLHDYLAGLEKLPWRMFWSRASLSAENHPRLTLTVTIYTLSLDKAWLVV